MFMKRVYDPKYFEGKKHILNDIQPLVHYKTLFYIPIKHTTYKIISKKEETKIT
jgi:hypothetical protein